MLARPKTERAWFDLLATNTKESVAWKGRFDTQRAALGQWVREMGGLKNYVTLCAEHAMQGGIPKGFSDGLSRIHPRALMLLAKYGEDFKTFSWDTRGAEPRPAACFENSHVQMSVFNAKHRANKSPERMFYVEGAAFGARSNPVHHAWNAFSEYHGLAYDWTWYSVASWCFYFGIAISNSQHNILRKLAHPEGGFHLLLASGVFPRIEDKLTEMLEQRRSERQQKLYRQVVTFDRDF